MTEDRLGNLQRKLQQFKDSLADISLPSCHTFTKCLSAWEETLASHLPYIHIPTLCLNDCIPELVLALAALGAQQRYETRTSLLLFHAGKTIALERIRLTRLRNKEAKPTPGLDQSETIIQSASALLTLIVLATWSANAELVDEAFELHRPLMFCLREDGLTDEDEMSNQDWSLWALSETRIRIKAMAFCFLNLHTIAYDHPPVLFWHEVDLKLPCTVREWHAMEEFQWLLARQEVVNEQRRFPESLKALLSSDGQTPQMQPAPSPLGNYVLLHGLLQRIYLIRQIAVTPILREEDIIILHKALSNWATTWQRTSESSLNPRDENGPIAFTSVALLGLAHVRVHLDIGPYRGLAYKLPAQVAAALAKVPSPQIQQTKSAVSALLYSIHALSIPVAIGIEYVVHTQAIFWCCQHSLGSLECAVFLSKWLYAISAAKAVQTMNRSEEYVLHCLRQVLTEAVSSADWGDINTSLWLEDAFHMGLAVLRIWSRVFSNSSAWPITVTIGKSLAIYADTYENRGLDM
ncbi:uncharacterized protein B0I36DRAFT_378351 [Microdochium trichocladiopsis]|uniref:Xylanolytic transcriptional activator regulatory domain-containing protein n=1 Tax=Microdochium trichocladiopsis TaxID=1682393 RepID=A0A9P8XR53_9PEZI|nr:uncharacterized protein B0I36DRAFT_378351 [Microdochium trichocladiopsis]KAH7012627.1 hypothetical protein B0I36DRAFT_378351 [Microdochium trichocladiopsis]